MFNIYINNDDCKIPEDEEIYYIVGQNGIFLKKSTDLIDCLVPVNNIAILNKVDACVKMNIPKIPEEIFSQIVSFFYFIHMTYHAEAAIVLFYDKSTTSFAVQVPLQEIDSGSVKYESLPNYGNYKKIGTIHSHSAMSAFHSSVDVKDEETFDGIHITVGKLNAFEKEKRVDIACSIVINGLRTIVEPENYIEGITSIIIEAEESVYNNFWTVSKEKTKLYIVKPRHFDEKWLQKVSKLPIVSTPKFQTYGSHFAQYFKFNKDYNTHPCVKCLFLDYKLLLQDEFDEFELEDEIVDVDGKVISADEITLYNGIDFSLFDEDKLS